MRKKVQYFIAFSNLIFQIAAFAILQSSPEVLYFRFEHEILTKVLAAFILLMPVAFVVMGNLLEKNEKYSGVYSYKAFPVIFIILLFASWIVCIYVNAALGPFSAEKQNWIMLVLGSCVMYLANYVTGINKDNVVLKKLGIKIKNEYVFKTTLRIALYAIGLEGYTIILCGAIGFFFNRHLSMTLMLLSLAAFAISVTAVYVAYTKMLIRRKTTSRRKKHDEAPSK